MLERPLAGRKVVLRPERLNADFQQLNRTLLTTFRWRLSQNAVEHAAIEGFQFTWKQLTPPSGVFMATEGQEETLISQSQTVAPVRKRAELFYFGFTIILNCNLAITN